MFLINPSVSVNIIKPHLSRIHSVEELSLTGAQEMRFRLRGPLEVSVHRHGQLTLSEELVSM